MKILVPIDFTSTTENALTYAIGLTKGIDHEITLFHVTESDKDSAAALSRLNEMSAKYKSEGATLHTHVITGNIFDHIGETASQIEASIIIMGTHGIKGVQHIVGSKAMRVITNSKTPYIVVQNKPYRAIKNVLVPIDFSREVKQMLPFLTAISGQFHATLHLLKEKSKDEFIQKKIDNNLSYFVSFLSDNKISFKVLENDFSNNKYKSVVKEANSIDADLIVTTIDPETGLTDYMMGVDEQKIVANESQIPVLCINIKNFMSKSGNIFEYTF